MNHLFHLDRSCKIFIFMISRDVCLNIASSSFLTTRASIKNVIGDHDFFPEFECLNDFHCMLSTGIDQLKKLNLQNHAA